MIVKSLPMKDLQAAAARLMTSDIFKTMPGFTVPLQERTRIKTAAIVAAVAYMLQTRGFPAISVDDIATTAQCSIPSIYARFKNKESLLPAVHLLIVETIRKRLDEEVYIDRFKNDDIMYFSRIVIDIMSDYVEINRNFVRAAILSEAIIVHQQYDALVPVFTARLNKIVPTLLNRDPDSTAPAVALAISLITSLMRDAAVVEPVPGTRDREVLAKLFSTIIEANITPHAGKTG